MQRILIVDDHLIVRRGIQDILSAEHPNARFGEASNGQEALQLIAAKSWDLILLDIAMPGLGGFEVLKEMGRRRIKTPVLILSIHSESQFGERALKAGAAGYVSKQDAAEVLLEAVSRFLPVTADMNLGEEVAAVCAWDRRAWAAGAVSGQARARQAAASDPATRVRVTDGGQNSRGNGGGGRSSGGGAGGGRGGRSR